MLNWEQQQLHIVSFDKNEKKKKKQMKLVVNLWIWLNRQFVCSFCHRIQNDKFFQFIIRHIEMLSEHLIANIHNSTVNKRITGITAHYMTLILCLFDTFFFFFSRSVFIAFLWLTWYGHNSIQVKLRFNDIQYGAKDWFAYHSIFYVTISKVIKISRFLLNFNWLLCESRK